MEVILYKNYAMRLQLKKEMLQCKQKHDLHSLSQHEFYGGSSNFVHCFDITVRFSRQIHSHTWITQGYITDSYDHTIASLPIESFVDGTGNTDLTC